MAHDLTERIHRVYGSSDLLGEDEVFGTVETPKYGVGAYAVVRLYGIFHAMPCSLEDIGESHDGKTPEYQLAESFYGDVYAPPHPSTTFEDVEEARYAYDDGTYWQFAHCSPEEQIEFAAECEAFAFNEFNEAIHEENSRGVQATNNIVRSTAFSRATALRVFAREVGRRVHSVIVSAPLGFWHKDKETDHKRKQTIAAINHIHTTWSSTNNSHLAHLHGYDTKVKNRLSQAHTVRFRHEVERLAALAGDEPGGYEYIYVSSTDGAEITDAANLPNPDWIFDHPALAGGMLRGTTVYYDKSPPDLSATRPFIIRFRRPVKGTPFAGQNIGTVAWTQEKAYRAVAQPSSE